MGVLTRDMVPPQATVLPRRRRSGPVLLREGEGAATLSRIPLVGSHSEAWLQSLIHDHPELLPVDDLEPSFAELVPAAMEVACKAGYIDNLFVTPQGDIVLVEAKLWNNPQARREVVAQTLDYVGALSAMSYVEFEAAILKARHDGSTGLHALIPPALEPLAEPDFIDAVTRNLARGRMLALVVGNGIREEVQQLASVLQSHAGAHFTFGLVEVGLWRDMATGDIVAVPDTLAQTVMIERGVVRVENGQPVIKPVEAKSTVMVKTISTELFDEALAKRDPALPAMLHAAPSNQMHQLVSRAG